MKLLVFVAGVGLVFVACKNESFQHVPISIIYPETRMDTAVMEDYHGAMIADPFRWLEDDHAAETMEWVDRQNEVTFGFLEQIPYRENIRTRLEQLWDYEKYSSPFKEGNYYYYFKNDGLQNQSVLYRSTSIEDDGEVFLDPNTFSEDGTTSLAGMSFNKEGNLLAYMISEGGSDWRTLYIKDVESGELLEDKLDWIKFSGISWAGNGFFYSRYPTPEGGSKLSKMNENHTLCYHTVGSSQLDDIIIHRDMKHPQRNVYGSVTEDESILLISTSESTSGNAFSIVDLSKGIQSSPISVISEYHFDYSLVEKEGDILYILTNDNAPRYRMIGLNVKSPAKDNWVDIIPESENALRGASVMGGKIFTSYLKDANSMISVFDLHGNHLENLQLPGLGTVSGISGKKSDTQGFFTFTSFTTPPTIYQLDAGTLQYREFRSPRVNFDASKYETRQVKYKSKDGTEIPMFITMKKGTKLNGSNPALLYGYGGFNIPVLPSFSVSRIPFLENGGIYCVANIRGGGEYGKDWHLAGTKERKQNVFDDFISAAEYLIDQGYTSNEKLAIEGGSNGGLLVGACMTQRPDLFAVAIPRVGVLDMLRYHQFTIGWAWAFDYGRSDDPSAFEYLIQYSPLHNIKEAEYPATLVTTADHDDRVVPAHSFKFIAELQRKHQGENPVLIRIDKSAGHGAGKPTTKAIEETADILAFMLYNMKEDFLTVVKG
ncbi:MAG TPA: prolyl oligopeptidase family serine peptidase [Saprospiraceae bacterium]|nr:prolyl oligopeptidase family serine peptidase [Saprospiraceae bacterium]